MFFLKPLCVGYFCESDSLDVVGEGGNLGQTDGTGGKRSHRRIQGRVQETAEEDHFTRPVVPKLE